MHLGFAEFSVNDPLPPLEYLSETFDLVYAISVFTHLNEDYQFRWPGELKRITEQKGIVLLTVHGRHAWNNFSREDITDIRARGFKFVTSNTFKSIFPEWYQTVYHTRDTSSTDTPITSTSWPIYRRAWGACRTWLSFRSPKVEMLLHEGSCYRS